MPNPIVNGEAGETVREKINTSFTEIATLQSQAVPAGGATGQVLSKISGSNYAMQWADPAAGGGGALPAGGNAGQVLTKNSSADGDASWQTPSAGGGTGLTTVSNIAALKTITPTAGAVVMVQGYATPGDGGGGLFRADMSGAIQTDGGIAFTATVDESAQQSQTQARVTFTSGFSLGQANLIWGSVQVDPVPAGATVVFNDIDMHGHRLNSGGFGLYPLVNHKTGAFPADPQKRFDNYLARYGGASDPREAVVRYKYATNARRWVRQHDGYVLDVRWFGVTTGAVDQRDKIAWALNAAKRLGFKEVRLNGSYSYLGGLELPAGVAFGWGKLTVMGNNAAAYHMLTNWETLNPGGTVREALAGNETCICPEDNSALWELHKLEVDGNYFNNKLPFEDYSLYTRSGYQTTNPDNVRNLFQNTPSWNGFSSSNHSGRIIPWPQHGVMVDVDIHGFGGNCWLGHGHTIVDGRNVRLGDSVKNHVFYGMKGTFTNLTCYGFSWGSWGKTEHLQVNGLNFEKLRGFDFTVDQSNPALVFTPAVQLIAYEGLRRGTGTMLTGSEFDRWKTTGLAIVGGKWDLDGFIESGSLFTGGGQGLSVRDVTIMGPIGPVAGLTEIKLVAETTLGSETELWEGWSFENITIMQRGVAVTMSSSNDPDCAILRAKDVTIQDWRGYEGVGAAASMWTNILAGTPRTGPNVVARKVLLEGVRTSRGTQNLAAVRVTSASAIRAEIVVRDSNMAFTTNAILRNNAGTGTLAGYLADTGADLEKIRALWENSELLFPANATYADAELLFALSSWKNCRTRAGLKSENGGVYTASGSVSSVDIATGLMWAPRLLEVRITRAAGAVTGLTATLENTAGSALLGAGADRRAPNLALAWTGALAAGDTIRWRAGLGGPDDGEFILGAVALPS